MKKNSIKSGWQVFEISAFGGKHSVTKIYPTYLGCKRALVRIRRENKNLDGYKYTMQEVKQ